jgi:hypothetical protein
MIPADLTATARGIGLMFLAALLLLTGCAASGPAGERPVTAPPPAETPRPSPLPVPTPTPTPAPVRIDSPIGGGTCGGTGQPICEFKAATFVGRGGCTDGGFFDPRSGGECWKCPEGTNRTVFPVTANNACQRPAKVERLAVSSKRQATGLLKTDCPKGYFLHQLSGWCYACPSGHARTVFAIDGNQACERTIPTSWHAATRQKSFGCQAPAFLDPRNGGECWRCPAAWNRSIFPVNGDKACTAPAGQACAAGLAASGGRCVVRAPA